MSSVTCAEWRKRPKAPSQSGWDGRIIQNESVVPTLPACPHPPPERIPATETHRPAASLRDPDPPSLHQERVCPALDLPGRRRLRAQRLANRPERHLLPFARYARRVRQLFWHRCAGRARTAHAHPGGVGGFAAALRRFRASVLPPLQHTASAPAFPLSRLNHAALALPVYALQPRSPSVHARLGSGWWPAFPGRAFHPQGSCARFQLMLSWSSSSPRLCLAHMPFGQEKNMEERRNGGDRVDQITQPSGYTRDRGGPPFHRLGSAPGTKSPWNHLCRAVG
jgi:hypothetical protein